MVMEIPQFCLRAYALFFLKHNVKEAFRQSELDWIVGQSMKKKIFSILLRSGWIKKENKGLYKCKSPNEVITGLFEFKLPSIIKTATKPYVFTGSSAIEVWSDYAYIQRGIEKSPYYIKILRKDLRYWKNFLNKNQIPNYLNEGTTIGEYVIFIPVRRIVSEEFNGMNVEPLKKTIKMAKDNELWRYAYNYMRKKYESTTIKRKRNI